MTLIDRRKKPDVISARSIISRGVGASGWSRSSDQTSQDIQNISAEIFRLLFEPELSYPIKSLNLPVAGSVYAGPTLKMIHDFVQIVTVTVENKDDLDGVRTFKILKRVRRAAELLCSNSVRSVGLHPAVYFYSWTGKHQPILFLTMSETVLDAERKSKLPKFISRRAAFEGFIQKHRTLINQIVRKFGTKDSGRQHLKKFYYEVFNAIDDGLSNGEIVNRLVSSKAFTYLQPGESPYSGVSPTRYSVQVKSCMVINELLPNARQCTICGGLVPYQAISIDHKERLADGGNSHIENLRITHGYCNSGIKEAETYQSRKNY